MRTVTLSHGRNSYTSSPNHYLPWAFDKVANHLHPPNDEDLINDFGHVAPIQRVLAVDLSELLARILVLDCVHGVEQASRLGRGAIDGEDVQAAVASPGLLELEVEVRLTGGRLHGLDEAADHVLVEVGALEGVDVFRADVANAYARHDRLVVTARAASMAYLNLSSDQPMLRGIDHQEHKRSHVEVTVV